MAKSKGFEDFDLWKRAHRIVLDIYRISEKLPESEHTGLRLQMRKAAVIIPSNIAEGFRRRVPRDRIHHYNMALTATEEVKYFLILANDLAYLNAEAEPLINRVNELVRILYSTIHNLTSEYKHGH